MILSFAIKKNSSLQKICSECKNYFCGSCVSRETPSGQVRNSTSNSSFNNAPRTCKRCKILLSIPPVRADLMELRVKDLQRYLISKKVNTKSCVGEYKDMQSGLYTYRQCQNFLFNANKYVFHHFENYPKIHFYFYFHKNSNKKKSIRKLIDFFTLRIFVNFCHTLH